jgi:hypothetical protein
MWKTMMKFCIAAAGLCLTGALCPVKAQQVDDDLMARRRVFKPIGPGLRALRRGPDGTVYVLISPGSSVSVFDAKGALLKKIPDYAQNQGPASQDLRAIQFGEDMDVAANGTLYVADRGADEIKIWEQSGNARAFHVSAPLSLAALLEGEVAVATQNNPRLVTEWKAGSRNRRPGGTLHSSGCESLPEHGPSGVRFPGSNLLWLHLFAGAISPAI